nr:SGNH/GDSL hydrolase family protein [Rhodococcus sp. (in: high G+C Gram-positive bacteria)]
MKIRNYDSSGRFSGDAITGLSGITIGKAAIGTDGVPNGSFQAGTAVQLSTGGNYTIPNDGTYWTSAWFTDPAAQLAPGALYLLAVANTIATGETKNVLLGTSWQFNGTNTVLDPTTAPTSATPSQSRFDVQIEFESLTDRKSGAMLGDSITEGNTAGRQPAYQSWPTLWAASHRSIATNVGVSGRTLGNWADTAHAVWSTIDWPNIVFDFAFIGLGSNDIESDRTLSQMQADFLGVVANLRSRIGTKPIYAATVLPRKFSTAKETVRSDYNAWLATCPGGITAVIDFATMMTDPLVAAPPQLLPLYDSDGSHPKPLGYARMAATPGQLG